MLQKEAHGGIDVLVRACDEIPLLFQDPCEGSHSSAANAHEMDSLDMCGKAVEVGRKIRVSGWIGVF